MVFDLPRYGRSWGVVLGESGQLTKSELIARIAEVHPHLTINTVTRIVSAIFDEISAALARGKRVELRGFGAFSVKARDPRIGRNPRTGMAVHVGPKYAPAFRAGCHIRGKLNGAAKKP